MAAPVKAAKGSDDNMIFGILAYLLGIIGFLIVLLAKRDNKFAMYHAKQSLVLTIVALIVFIPGTIIAIIFGLIPVIGWIIALLIWLVEMVVLLGLLIFVVLGIINVVNNQMKPLPVIGRFGEKFNF
jgi:uncharacterized membrane protein